MNDLVVAALFFIGTHLGLSAQQLRTPLVERVGERVFLALYSLIATVALIWLVLAWSRAPVIPLWYGGPLLDRLPLLLMPPALLLLVGGLAGPNPTAVGQAPDPDAAEPASGVLRITRHPVMWGIALWAISHLLANPDLASLVFFGAFTALALGGSAMMDMKRAAASQPGFGILLQTTSWLPFLAIVQRRQRFVWREIGWRRLAMALVLYAALAALHPWFAGVPVV